MSFCKECISGVRYEGVPEGTLSEINGVKVYIATPTVDYPADTVLLFLPDIYGVSFVNSRLLADDFARNGFRTIIPDYLNGDDAPLSAMLPGSTFSLLEWFQDHGSAETTPTLNKVIEGLKAEGVTVFGATGYCFGGRYAMNLAFENITKAIVISHPSLLILPEDFEQLLATSSNPILINTCENDRQFPLEQQKLADELLGEGKYKPGYVRKYFAGCTHGFAVRGDPSDPIAKAGKEEAFKATVEFLLDHLQAPHSTGKANGKL